MTRLRTGRHVPLPPRRDQRIRNDRRPRPHLQHVALQPVVRTEAARDATATTATLTGSVDPRTRATNWWFEYGTTTGYGSQTASRSAGSGGTARAVSAAVSGLKPGTTYHYRLVARNDAGTTRGADAALTTVGVTLTAPAFQVVYGRGILLSGLVPTRRAGETVIVFASRSARGRRGRSRPS